jgi:hypothetical protein
MTEEDSIEVERIYSELSSEIRELVYSYTSHLPNEEVGDQVKLLLAERFRFDN